MELSPDQRAALNAVKGWLATEKPTLTLGGYAGTGKTTLISKLLADLGTHDVAVCAFTGKAASVLRGKGVPATTMHRLIYQPEKWCDACERIVETLGKGKVCATCNRAAVRTKFMRVPFCDIPFVIVDEASMLNLSHVQDLEELVPKILYVGDHGQLEPIGRDPGVMRNPELRLEKIHRQAETSRIIQFAHHVRQQRSIKKWTEQVAIAHQNGKDTRCEVVVRQGQRPSGIMLDRSDIVLCGYNNTRVAVNRVIRKLRSFTDDLPEPGERLICLQNDVELGLFNGLLVTVINRHPQKFRYDHPRYDFVDDIGKEYFAVPINPDQFGQEKKLERTRRGLGVFDFGYCLTCHKSQGSEFEKVAVLEQIAGSWESARWRYTAATRASMQLEWWISGGR
jgi:exodeoxyribonuclease-5